MWRADGDRGSSGNTGDEPDPGLGTRPFGSSLGIGRHHHGDEIHAHLEPHPHSRGSSTTPSVGIVGAGAAASSDNKMTKGLSNALTKRSR